MTIGVEGREGNALQLFDPARGELKVLDSRQRDLHGARVAQGFGRPGGAAVEEGHGLRRRIVHACWRGRISARRAPARSRRRSGSSASRAPQWSRGRQRRSTSASRDWDQKIEPKKSDEEPSNVEVWHPKDVDVISEQKLQLARDRDRNVAAAWHVAEGRIVPLGTNVKENVQLPRTGTRAVAIDETPYDSDGMFGRRFADVYKVDLAERRARRRSRRAFVPPVWPSPGGQYAAEFQGRRVLVYDLETGAQRNVSQARRAFRSSTRKTIIRRRTRPSWGVAGWTKNDASVIVYDEFDLWELFPDGAKPRRLTDGAAEQVRHRYVNPEAPAAAGAAAAAAAASRSRSISPSRST